MAPIPDSICTNPSHYLVRSNYRAALTEKTRRQLWLFRGSPPTATGSRKSRRNAPVAKRFCRKYQRTLPASRWSSGTPFENYPIKHALSAHYEGAHGETLPVRLDFRCKFHKTRHQIYKKVRSCRLCPPPAANWRDCHQIDSSLLSLCAACKSKTCLGHRSHVEAFVFSLLEPRSPFVPASNGSIFRGGRGWPESHHPAGGSLLVRTRRSGFEAM